MNFDITFGYPTWLLIFCLLLGGGYATLLYYRNYESLGRKLSIVLGALRFLTVFFLAVLILAPMIERIINIEEDPMILFVQDNSGSVGFGTDSAYYLNEYKNEVQSFKEELSHDYDVRTYTFGESFNRNSNFTFDERLTNMSDIFEGLQTSYSNRNVGAVILASDGIYNRGINPLYASRTNNFSVYSVALGDTTAHKDVILTDVLHNRVTYLGNKFPVQVHIEARECKGESSTLTINKDDRELFSKTIDFTTNHHFETVDLTLEAEEVGLERYDVNLSAVDGEVNIENNSKELFIEVIDSRQKVLILYNTPHPDAGAIKQSLEANEHYEVKSSAINDFNDNVEQFNLVILHQLPSFENPRHEILENIYEQEIPRLFINGSQTNISAFNNLPTGVNIQTRSEQFSEALPNFNQGFALFSIEDDTEDFFSSLPPLYSHFADYEIEGNARVFLNQKIGNVVTDDPLIIFSDDGTAKTGVITGEGIWRWRLHNYMHKQNHNIFDEIISKKVQYLSVLEDKSHLQVFGEPMYYENEPVEFSAEVYNQSFELINEPELHLSITGEDGAEYPYVFNRTTNAYSLNAGTYPAGDYQYEAEVTVGDQKYSQKGEFSVAELNIEQLQTIANHQLMYRLASENDGKLFYPGQWNELADELKQRDDIKPVLYSQKQFEEAISLRGIFFLIILLITIEWFVRRRSGVY